MPFTPSINIHTDDLKKIMDALEQKKLGRMKIQIVDGGNSYVLRDSGGMVITYVSKGMETFQNNSEDSRDRLGF